MQYIAVLATLFAAALSAPSEMSVRQADFSELGIWSRSGCADGSFTGTFPINNGDECQVLPPGVTASKVQTSLPAGCSLTFYTNTFCNSTNFINIPRDQQPFNCFEAGQGREWESVFASGTC